MIISPPFLSLRDIPVYDDQCVKSVMPGGIVGSGAYPVSQAMAWHGGLHIHAPTSDEPVRAIADGTVIFRRDGFVAGRPGSGNARYDNEDHSTGCVVIRHTTEIGAQGTTPVTVVYYSITQHLRQLDGSLPAVGRAVHRKDPLGLAGTIHGQGDRIHLEIVAGDADVQGLVGRNSGNLDTSRSGRSDAVFGKMHVLVPAKSPYYSAQPVGASAAPAGDTGNDDLFISIHYAGNAELETVKVTGERVGQVSEAHGAYSIYAEAAARHKQAAAGSSPSGWYELLRFGRNLGPDPLPAHAPHWRKVAVPGQTSGAWVDLNAGNTRKFSDADFPHWAGWRLIDDDTTDNDSRCDSAIVQAMLSSPQGVDGTAPTPAQKAADRARNLCRQDIQETLAKTVCKFPTEWAKNEVRAGWAWTRSRGNPLMPYPLEDETDFTEMTEFAQKLCFWEELPAEDKARLTTRHWHFHPGEFINHFRKSGWLSAQEMASVIAAAPADGRARAEALRLDMNLMLRKYLIAHSRLLQAHFLAQVGHETGWWRFREELGNDRYFRTMYEVITPAEAAQDHNSGLAQRLNLVQRGEAAQAYAARRPGAVATKAKGMDNGLASAASGGMAGDGPRFRGRGFLQITGRRNYASYGAFRGHDFVSDPNPRLLASNDFNACDASGFFWARERAGAEASAGFAPVNVTRVGGIVNRGSAGRVPLEDRERQLAFAGIWGRLNDAP